MIYFLSVSRIRAVLAGLFTLSGSSALCIVLIDRIAWAGALSSGLAFAVLCFWQWRVEARRQPVAIRLMGAGSATLYYLPGVVGADNGMRSANVGLPRPGASRPIDVHIDRIVHWPGRLLGLTVRPAVPASQDGAGAREERPRVRQNGGGLRVFASKDFFVPRHLLLFADTMPSPRFRALAIQLRCARRGVTVVEHR